MGDSPELDQVYEFGATGRVVSKAKLSIIKNLFNRRSSAIFGGSRALEVLWGAFQMTKCEERQARRKGLTCHFLQIVPTCL